MTVGRRLRRACGLTIVVGLGIGLWASVVPAARTAASAAEDGVSAGATVQLSTDREHWAENLTVSLLDPRQRWVPGDSETAVLWIRNASEHDADGYAEVTFGSAAVPLADDLTVRTRYGTGPWASGTTSPAFRVAAGARVRLGVEVAYPPTAGNDGMSQTVPMSVRVVLAGADGTAGPPPGEAGGPGRGEGPDVPGAGPAPPGGPGEGGGALPVTGAEILRVAVAAGLLVVAGAWIVEAARRRGPHHG